MNVAWKTVDESGARYVSAWLNFMIKTRHDVATYYSSDEFHEVLMTHRVNELKTKFNASCPSFEGTFGGNHVYFASEEDLSMFLLRYS